MPRTIDLLLTALAPIIWGSSYYVTTEFLPQGYPITVAMLRALPAGLFLLLCVRQLPKGQWWWKLFLLGALNFSFFWAMLFVAAYRLPGGVAATVGAMQPIIIIFLAHSLLKDQIRITAMVASLLGAGGVSLLVLNSTVTLDLWGVVAGLSGAFSMALGIVLTKKWQPPVSLLTFTAWQLTTGGMLLIPFALYFEPPLPELTMTHISGFVWLGLAGAVISYFFWFRGIVKTDVSTVSILGFLSPLTAVLLGWFLLDQRLTFLQLFGVCLVLISIWVSQISTRKQQP